MGCIVRNSQKHNAARDWRQTQQRENWPLHLPMSSQPRTAHRRDELHCAKWHIQQNSVEGIESKGLDNQGPKGRDASAGDTTGKPVSKR